MLFTKAEMEILRLCAWCKELPRGESENLPAKKQGNVYLAAYALRQEPQKLLWYTQMKGFYYTGDYVFIPYYVVPENKGIYTNNEQREFMSKDILVGRKPFVIFTGNGVLEEIVDGIMTPKERNQKQTYDTFAEAFDLFACPTAVIPLDENGMRTLEVLKIPNYRQRLIQALLGDDYAPPINESFDAFNKQTGQNYVVGFDCNISRLQRAFRQSIENQACIVCFGYQKEVIEKYCWADVRTCDLSEVERVFRLPRISDRRSNEPFKAKGGKYIDVPPKKLL